MDNDNDLEHRIRQRAYALWEAEGRPDGRREAHWNEAWREIAARQHGDMGTPPPVPDAYRPEGDAAPSSNEAPMGAAPSPRI